MDIKNVSEWRPFVTPILESKVEELHLLGYDKATVEDVWECLLNKVWKKNKEKKLHQIVQDILHLSAGTYMSYLTLEIYQTDDLMAQIEALNDAK